MKSYTRKSSVDTATTEDCSLRTSNSSLDTFLDVDWPSQHPTQTTITSGLPKDIDTRIKSICPRSGSTDQQIGKISSTPHLRGPKSFSSPPSASPATSPSTAATPRAISTDIASIKARYRSGLTAQVQKSLSTPVLSSSTTKRRGSFLYIQASNTVTSSCGCLSESSKISTDILSIKARFRSGNTAQVRRHELEKKDEGHGIRESESIVPFHWKK